MTESKPNVVIVLADQWRAQACGYAGDSQVQTPHLDRLAAESINYRKAVSGIPVCTPARGCMLTGLYAQTHGLFVNDVHLADDVESMGKIFGRNGYDTAYIGKWHVDGRGRDAPIPRESRQGFEYWKVLECTHSYNRSLYYDHDKTEPDIWSDYDARDQTRDACRWLEERSDSDKPFLLFLSWGPPHDPYETAPPEFKAMYDPDAIELRPNVPPEVADLARERIAGYYAHCSALDSCVGELRGTLQTQGLEENTIFLFLSDHGDMLGSQGQHMKQRPWEESIRVPFLLRWPAGLGTEARTEDAPIDIVDVLPTLLGLCGLEARSDMEGLDYSGHVRGGEDPSGGQALVMCLQPFGQFVRTAGGREYRGLVTDRYTYVEDLSGPWLLYDNEGDPFQLNNLVDQPDHAEPQASLRRDLHALLDRRNDKFLSGDEYVEQFGYTVDETGTVGYTFLYGRQS